MSDVALHIEYLLTKHDCVIVPGWGAFVVQYSDAFYFAEGTVYKKPHKNISFNQSVCHNDGLLVNSVIRRSGMTYDAANREIEDFVASLRKQLDYDGLVAIGRLGLFKKRDDLVIFEPNRMGGRCSDSFGLLDLKIKTLAQLASENAEHDNETELEERPEVRLYIRRFAQVAASIIILICAGFVLSTPLRFEQATDYAGLENAVKIKTPSQKVALKTDGELTIALPLCAEQEQCVKANTDAVSEVEDRSDETNEVSLPHNEDGEYYLIVSSLDTREQAEKYVRQHDGEDLRILERNNRFRVYVAQSSSFKSLNRVRRSVSSEYPDAWIYR